MSGQLNAPTVLFSSNSIPNDKRSGWAPPPGWMLWERSKYVALAGYREWLCVVRSWLQYRRSHRYCSSSVMKLVHQLS